MHAAISISPIVVLVVVLNSEEGVGEDVYEGHSDGRTQPAVKSGLSAVSQTLKLSYLKTVLFPLNYGCVWLDVRKTVLQSNLR